MKRSFLFLIFFPFILACTNNSGPSDHLKALEKEWEKHLQPKDSIVNVMKAGETFALESSEVQGVDHERFKEFDYWKEYDESFFERSESKDFSNPLEDGGTIFSLEIFKAIKKGETEFRFYKKHYYGNKDPMDSTYIKDTTAYLYNTYKFRIE